MGAFCQHCGQPIPANARFCQHCGQTQPAAASAPDAPVAVAPSAPPPSYSYGAPAVAMRYGGFWVRFVAFIIDCIVVGLVTAPFRFLFFAAGMNHRGFEDFDPSHMAMAASIIAANATLSLAATLIYEAGMVSSSKQATLGKMVFRMKVTDLNGQRLSFLHAVGRYFAKWVSSITLCIGYIMVAFTERKQGLHDMIAGTLVVQEQSVPYPIVPQQPV